MRRCFWGFILLIIFSNNLSSQIRSKLPNDVGMELAGKSLIYSFSGQYTISNRIGLSGGISLFGMSEEGDNNLVIFVPMGARFYFLKKNASPYFTSGIVLLNLAPMLLLFKSEEKYNYFGLGFEYRADSGILVRGTLYCLQNENYFLIWPGIHVGFAF